MSTLTYAPTAVDFVIQRGDNIPFGFDAVNAAGGVMDFTNCTIRMTVRPYAGESWDSAAVAIALMWTQSVSNGITVSSVVSGHADVLLTAAQTAALSPSKIYRYDLEVTDGNGVRTTTHEGNITVRADVSI